MAYAINSGLVDDQDILQNERVVEMSDVFDQIEEDVTQFTSAMMKVSSRKIESSKAEWLEDRLFPRISALAASVSSDTTAMTVTAGEGAYFNVGDVVRILPTGEAFTVAATAASAITAANRGLGEVAAATAQTGSELVIVGNAYAQGATLGTPKVVERVAQYNYTQIVRHPFSFTRTLTQSRLYGGNEPNKERKKKAVEHKRALEQLMFFGARDLITSGSEPVGYMGGLSEFVTENVHAVNGTLASTAFDLYLQTDLQWGNDKVLFCAPTIARSLSYFAANNWVQSTPSDKLYGIKVDAFYSGAYGYKLPVFVKRDWQEFGNTAGIGYGYGSWGFIVDMSAVQLLSLQPTVLLRNRQANDADRVTEEYLTELSLEVRAGGLNGFGEGKHAILKGVTGPAAS